MSQPTVRSLASYKSAALPVSEHTTAWSSSSESHESGGRKKEKTLPLRCSLKQNQHLFSIYSVFPVPISPTAALRYASLHKDTLHHLNGLGDLIPKSQTTQIWLSEPSLHIFISGLVFAACLIFLGNQHCWPM